MIGTIGLNDLCWQRLCEIDSRLNRIQRADLTESPTQRLDDCSGLLLSGADVANDDQKIAATEIATRFIETGHPVLAFAAGAYILNDAFCDRRGRQGIRRTERNDTSTTDAAADHQSRTTLFLTVGSKVAMTIGGSGWLTIRDVEINPMPMADLSPELMPSAITEDSSVAAFEMAGHHWVIGITWDVADSAAMPKGFTNLLEAFVDRTED